jgi:hypothetical protein
MFFIIEIPPRGLRRQQPYHNIFLRCPPWSKYFSGKKQKALLINQTENYQTPVLQVKGKVWGGSAILAAAGRMHMVNTTRNSALPLLPRHPNHAESPYMAENKGNRFWPALDSQEAAERAMHNGAAAAAFVAVLTTVLVVIGPILGHPDLGMTPWSLIDAVLFAIAAWRMYRFGPIF